MGLLLHCGGELATLEDLRHISLPEKTPSYQPVSHYELALALGNIAARMLPEYQMVNSQYGVARNGNQLFGVHTYRNGHQDLGLTIGFRNSYDKSLSIGIAAGASVFVCDNLALTGQITLMRKHTTNVLDDLESLAFKAIYHAGGNFRRIAESAESMKGIPIDDSEAYRNIGYLYGKGVLTPRQLPVAKSEWLKPSHDEFRERNLWSFYNACTESLKSCPPAHIMERHIHLHELLTPTAEVVEVAA